MVASLRARCCGCSDRLLHTAARDPRLRISEGQTAQARFGDQVPVPVTTFAQIATGGLPPAADHLVRVQDVGVNIDMTPRAHDGEVTLTLKLDISGRRRAGYQGLPDLQLPHRQLDDPAARPRDQPARGLILDDERTG